VSKPVERGFEVALTVIWLGGAAYFREVLNTGWLEPIVLLVVVVIVEVVFVRWNTGHWPGGEADPEDSATPSSD
jgi:hypothetical protein